MQTNIKIINLPIMFIFILNIFIIPFCYAETVDLFKDEMVEVQLVYPNSGLNNYNPSYIGLEFILDKDWKIYWKSPGDSGSPPSLDLSKSHNIENYEIKWPVPVKINETDKIVTNVYFNKVFFPISLTKNNPDNPAILKGKLSFQVCKTICIPMETDLDLTIVEGDAFDSEFSHVLEKKLSEIPLGPKETGINKFSLYQISDSDFRLDLERNIPFPDGTLNLFLEKQEGKILKINTIKNIETGNKNRILADINIFKDQLNDNNGYKNLGITLSKGNLAVYNELSIITKNNPNFFIMILIALLGGFILNFMPCVFPVLSLKVSRFISVKNISKYVIKYNFLYTSLGIIFSFLVIAFFTIFLKFMGKTIGWGIQFQQPMFVSFLAVVVLFFSAYLFGLFQFGLPSSIYTKIDKYLRYREKGTAFLEGAFATLLATPCSAPFLGTAVGYAISSNLYNIMLIFLFLGIGMSIPYLLFFISPNLIDYLPKPGKWIKKLNFLLGLGLVMTAIWLLSVVLELSSSWYVFFIIFTTSVLIFVFSNKKLARTLIFTILLFLSSGSIYFYDFSKEKFLQSNENTDALNWIKFNEQSIGELVNEGNIVFVDITADWCVTCKLNKMLVLDNKKTINLLESQGIILMRGDWTKEDKNISSFLSSWQRYGIPLNVIYGPKARKGILLSEILTVGALKNNVLNAR